MGEMKFRFSVILSTLYLVIDGFLSVNCFLHIGHWPGCKYAYYLSLPAGFIIPEASPLGFIWAFLIGLAQYALLGFFLDGLFRRI
jgi:hypothetical protein